MPRFVAPLDRARRTLRRGLYGLGPLLAALSPGAASMAAQAWNPEPVVQAAARHGARAIRAAQALDRAVALAQAHDELAQVSAVNAFYNQQLEYRDDMEAWGEVDYWASPLESLQRGMADCEDFAIAKYFTLTAMGVPHRKLRLVYVRAVLGDATGATGGPAQPHMVLAYYPNPQADPFVLDNLVAELHPAGHRLDLTPVFSFNVEGLWEGVGPVAVGGAGPTERLSRWRDALAKARDDGFSP